MPVVVTTDDINLILSAMGVALLVLMRPEMHATVAAVVVSIEFRAQLLLVDSLFPTFIFYLLFCVCYSNLYYFLSYSLFIICLLSAMVT